MIVGSCVESEPQPVVPLVTNGVRCSQTETGIFGGYETQEALDEGNGIVSQLTVTATDSGYGRAVSVANCSTKLAAGVATVGVPADMDDVAASDRMQSEQEFALTKFISNSRANGTLGDRLVNRKLRLPATLQYLDVSLGGDQPHSDVGLNCGCKLYYPDSAGATQ